MNRIAAPRPLSANRGMRTRTILVFALTGVLLVIGCGGRKPCDAPVKDLSGSPPPRK